jgi:FKBP12-rapamycin complex-associated protein
LIAFLLATPPAVDPERIVQLTIQYPRFASHAPHYIFNYVKAGNDRHRNNRMMKSPSAKLAHIDFGDCFEIAMRRECYPKKVSFRHTRMLLNALEVSGIEGTYRHCCENVLRVPRDDDDPDSPLFQSKHF